MRLVGSCRGRNLCVLALECKLHDLHRVSEGPLRLAPVDLVLNPLRVSRAQLCAEELLPRERARVLITWVHVERLHGENESLSQGSDALGGFLLEVQQIQHTLVAPVAGAEVLYEAFFQLLNRGERAPTGAVQPALVVRLDAGYLHDENVSGL